MTDSGEIYINGISGAKVYVNDKKMDMDGESLKRYLATIHSEDIDRIEVIPIPPAEYSAEGQGGIIRIIKRRSYGQGYEGTAQVKGFLLNYHAVAPYVAFRYSTEKSSLDISANTLTGREWLYVDSRTHDTKNSITCSPLTLMPTHILSGHIEHEPTPARFSANAKDAPPLKNPNG